MHSLQHELTLQYRNILIAAGAVAGSMTLVAMLTWIGGVEAFDLWPGYQLAMIIIGVLVTSGTFGELRSPGHRIAYLLRPSTVWEKAGSKILVTTVFVWLSVTAAFLVAALVSAGLLVVLSGGSEISRAFEISLAGGQWWRIAGETFISYLPAHAIFFFGSVYFRKHPAGRTLLSVVAWLGSYVVIAVLSVRVIFGRYLKGTYPGDGRISAFGREFGPNEALNFDGRLWNEVMPWYLQNPEALEPILTTAVVVIFWLLAVLRLRETEA
jgi:hypothetical protein